MSLRNKVQNRDQYGFIVENTPMDEMRTISPIRLVGSTFIGTTKDTNFWTTTILASGGTIATAVQENAQITLSSKIDATGSVIMQSVRRARYTGGSSNRFRAQVQLGDTGKTNNTKRWGMFDGTDGAYFKLAGTTLSVCTRKTNSETAVASSSWNGSTTVPTLTNVNSYEIYITNAKVYFVIGGVLMHTVSASSTTWCDTTNLPVRIDNINSGNTTDTTISIRVATIYRLGELHTDTQYGRITTAATTVFKYGAGVFHRITLNNPLGTLITIYDNTSATGNVMAIIDTPAQANPVTLEYQIPFSTGLTVVSTGTWDATIIYE